MRDYNFTPGAPDFKGQKVHEINYIYDVLGNRTSKITKDYVHPDASPTAPVVTKEVYIDENGQLLLEYDNDGHLTRHNLYGAAVDQLLATDVLEFDGADDVPEHLVWALTDQLGSVRDVYSTTLNNGQAEHIAYSSFGTPVEPEDAQIANLVRQRHAGREYDAETGFYYNRARYYDPASQRFTSPDPLGFAAGDTNLYRYVGNSPVPRRATLAVGLARC